MNLIDLGLCIAQPQAILALSISRVFDHTYYQIVFPNKTPSLGDDWGWVHVINVILFNQEKLTLKFDTEAERDKRFTEILNQMEEA